MSFRSLLALGLALHFSSAPPAANAQSRADSAEVLVEAALVAVESMARNVSIHLDPRTELRKDSLAILVFDALKGVGYEEYREPGIPPGNVWLLSPGTVSERNDSTYVSATFRAFGSKEGSLNSYLYTMFFQVESHEGGLVLGQPHSRANGDGHLLAECWEDFYARTEEERKACFSWPRKGDPSGPLEADIL